MWKHLVAIRVFEKKYINGSAFDLVISELSNTEWVRRCNAPSYVLFVNKGMDDIKALLDGNLDPDKCKFPLIGLIIKGVQSGNPSELTRAFSKISQIFRMTASYNGSKGSCQKAKRGGCSIKHYDAYCVNPKDVEGFGHKIIRISTGIVNLKV